jgi:hypothetical protein
MVTWRVYNYFLSLSEAVHLSAFQYLVRKFVASGFAAMVTLFMISAYISNTEKTSSTTQEAEKGVVDTNQATSFDYRTPTTSMAKQAQANTSQNFSTSVPCPAGVSNVICNSPELSSMKKVANDAMNRANTRNQSDTAWVRNELKSRISACADDAGCIKSAYQTAIDDFNAIQTETR